MRRRELIIIGAGAAAWPLACARSRRRAGVGFLNTASPGRGCIGVAAFRQGLNETGYVEGQNVVIEYRWAEGHYDRLPALAADLVGRKVDVIVDVRRPFGISGKNATSTIPIVFTGRRSGCG